MMDNLIEYLKLREQINYYYLVLTIAPRRLDPIVKALMPNKIAKDNATPIDKIVRNECGNESNIPNADNNNKALEGICKSIAQKDKLKDYHQKETLLRNNNSQIKVKKRVKKEKQDS